MKGHRPRLLDAYSTFFAENNLDALVFPTTPLPARAVGTDGEVVVAGRNQPAFGAFIRNTDPGSNAGITGVTLNVGFTSHGLPVGIAFDVPAGQDRSLLTLATARRHASAPSRPTAIALKICVDLAGLISASTISGIVPSAV